MDKSFILDETKRTAADNGGKPPGKKVFASVTGIEEHDWGQYWARWSRAFAAAGFAAAATARHYRHGVLATNSKEFSRVPGLRVVAFPN